VLVSLSVLVALPVAAAALVLVARRANVPSSVALAGGAMLLAAAGLLPGLPRLEPEGILFVCLPALLFAGGFSSDLRTLRAVALPVLLLAGAGTVVAVGVAAVALRHGLRIEWGSALALAAILAGPDASSVRHGLRRVGAPSRLAGILKGETLAAAVVALVIYEAIVRVPAVPAQAASGALVALAGGAGLGAAAALVASFALRRIGDPLVQLLAAIALAYGAWALGGALGVSGAVAAAAAGIAAGDTARRHLAPRSRIALDSLWGWAAFGVGAYLFFSMGLVGGPFSPGWNLPAIGIGLASVMAGRAAGVYLPLLLLRLGAPARAIPLRWQHVLVLGNAKGALCVAMALGLPAGFADRAALVELALGIALASLLIQGIALPHVIRRLGLAQSDPAFDAIDEERGRLIAAKAARAELDAMQLAGLLPRPAYDRLRSDYQVVIAGAERSLRSLQERHLAQGATMLLENRRRLIDAERSALVAASGAGLVAESTAGRLLAEIDERLFEVERILAGESEAKTDAAPGPGEAT